MVIYVCIFSFDKKKEHNNKTQETEIQNITDIFDFF